MTELPTMRKALIVRRIETIYRRVRKLEAERERGNSFGATCTETPPALPDLLCDTLETIDVASLAGKPVPSRLTSATKNPIAGLEYAVWCMGVTLMACGGVDLMHSVYFAFATASGDCRAGSWLDHRWTGVTDGKETWVA